MTFLQAADVLGLEALYALEAEWPERAAALLLDGIRLLPDLMRGTSLRAATGVLTVAQTWLAYLEVVTPRLPQDARAGLLAQIAEVVEALPAPGEIIRFDLLSAARRALDIATEGAPAAFDTSAFSMRIENVAEQAVLTWLSTVSSLQKLDDACSPAASPRDCQSGLERLDDELLTQPQQFREQLFAFDDDAELTPALRVPLVANIDSTRIHAFAAFVDEYVEVVVAFEALQHAE